MKTVLILLVRCYQICLSAPLHFLCGPFSGCRFEPSCSQYFIDAVTANGPLRGSWQGLRRILRCNPWGGQGYDPPPGWEEYVAKHPDAAYRGRRKPPAPEPPAAASESRLESPETRTPETRTPAP